MKNGIFVTGTDTDVGKTFVSALLISALKIYNLNPQYFKPVQTGAVSDSEELTRLTGIQPVTPVYALAKPWSPDRAAKLEGVTISLENIVSQWSQIQTNRYSIVEGAGGLLVPLNDKEKMRDLALALKLPVLVVARTLLGTINHTLLTLEAAKSAGLQVIGVVLNGPRDSGLDEVIKRHSAVPVINHISPFEKVNRETIERMATEYFPREFF